MKQMMQRLIDNVNQAEKEDHLYCHGQTSGSRADALLLVELHHLFLIAVFILAILFLQLLELRLEGGHTGSAFLLLDAQRIQDHPR